MSKRTLLPEARDALAAYGWRRRGGDVYTREVSAEVTGHLGINTVTSAGRLKLNPVVGVRHERLQRWVDRLLERSGSGTEATCVDTLAGLMPEEARRPYPQWWVEASQPPEARRLVWYDLAANVEAYGWPWVAAQTGLPEILEHTTPQAFSPWRYPVALWLLGRREEAVAYLEDLVSQFGRQPYLPGGVTPEGYGPFAERLLAEIDASPGGPAD